MKKRLFIVVLLSQCSFFVNAQGPAYSGSQPKSFNLLPNDFGFLANSVNQFTGQVQFSVPIMKLNGQGSLSYDFSINYSSVGISNKVNTWNREAPTGVLGLGWSFEMPRIIVDYKETASRTDDEFFLVENGVSNPLIYAGSSSSSSGSGPYVTQNFTNWKIQYDFTNEIWTITKEDGTTYTYGDKNSGRLTVQYMVKLGNWIGNSSVVVGQQQFVYVWNLSEIQDRWSDKLTFTYVQDTETVGSGGLVHTKASYLSEIKNLNYERISFVYQNKISNGTTIEYQDTHTESVEPDAYQEKYESRYLDKIIRYRDNGPDNTNMELFEIRFGYQFFGANELAKRQLTSITQYMDAFTSLPPTTFGYETSTSATSNTGALTSVQLPTKGSTSFVYSKLSLTGTSRSYAVNAYTDTNGNYGEPKLYYGDDFIVLTRRVVPSSGHSSSPQYVTVDVLTWDGGNWVQQSLGVFGPLIFGGRIAIGKDFFGIYDNSSTLILCKRDPNRINNWIKTVKTPSSQGAYPTFSAGNNFIFLGSTEGSINNNTIYYYDGSGWSSIPLVVKNNNSAQYFYAVANNYVLTHQDNPGGTSTQDQLTITYLTLSLTGAPHTNATSFSITGTNGTSSWYGANSYAAMFAAGDQVRIYNWDENFNITSTYNSGLATPSGAFATGYIVNNSMFFVSNFNGYAFRFTGSTWINSGILHPAEAQGVGQSYHSLSEDFTLMPMSTTGGVAANQTLATVFNPNTLAWYNPPELKIPLPGTSTFFAGYNYAAATGKIFYRGTNGTYNQLSTTYPDAPDNGDYLEGGVDFIAQVGNDHKMMNFKNGDVLSTEILAGNINDLYTLPQVGYNSVVTYTSWSSNLNDAYAFNVYRKINDQFLDQPIINTNTPNNISRFIATMTTTTDNVQPVNTTYDYNLTTAATDISGVIPQFNRVRTIPGSNSASSKPLGYTDNYFFNGLSNATVALNDSNADFGSETYNQGNGSNATQYNKRMLGAVYNSLTYSSSNTVTKSTSDGYTYYNALSTPGSSIPFYVRRTFSENYQDGYTTFSNFSYNTSDGSQAKSLLFLETTAWSSRSSSTIAEVAYTYHNEVYANSGLFLPVLKKLSRNGLYSDITATQWKGFGNWSNLWAPYQSFSWKNGSNDFTPYWRTSTAPSSNWQLRNTVVDMDLRGLPRETLGNDGVRKGIIYHTTKPFVLAEATQSSFAQMLYEGFEYNSNSYVTTANVVAGAKSATNATLSYTMPNGTYKVTYWKLVQGGSWTLIETSFTGTSFSISILANTWVDEIRICPTNALMTSYSYDSNGNLVTVCDPNNILTYYEYDAFNRQKITRDKDKNIVEYNTWHYKN